MGKYAIRNAVILDGTENMEPQKGKTIFIQDGKIEDIREETEIGRAHV